ncbi:MAG: hypothetical protein CL424_06400 [Acidimicrobiaceae bacterium]|nr:hypothetical protein [Acidimicrobiaceae bacterium]
MTAAGRRIEYRRPPILRDVAGERVDRVLLTKATMTRVSHLIEDAFASAVGDSIILAGFQHPSLQAAEHDRYEALAADPDRLVVTFAAGDAPGSGAMRHVSLPDGHPLTSEWFVIVVSPEFSCALFGTVGDELVAFESDRPVMATCTFESVIAVECAQALAAMVDEHDPELAADIRSRARSATTAPRPSPESSQHLISSILTVLEQQRDRWREQREINHSLQLALRRAESESLRVQNLASLGVSASSLAHELNNPLTSIGLAVELIGHEARAMLESTEPDLATWRSRLAEIADAAERAERVGHRMSDAVQTILGSVRPSDSDLESIDLAAWLGEFAEETSVDLGRSIVTDVAPATFVLAQDGRLRHIFSNLVRNAHQADASDSPITIRADVGAHDVMVSVVDRGPGIPPTLVQDVFEPFVSGRTATGGTGLGLALARQVAQDLRGDVFVSRTSGEGTVMTVRLSRTSPSSRTPPVREPTASLRGPVQDGRILVLDDDEEVRLALGSLLERTGYSVISVGDPATAIAEVRAHDYDTIFVDNFLHPSLTFERVVDDLEAARPGVRDRIVMITGSLASNANETAARLGVRVLLKPFSRRDLEQLLTDR